MAREGHRSLVVLVALWEDTLLIVGTDHGFLLGEHDWWAKNVQPWYNEVSHIPLFIWDPRTSQQGTRRESLVQWIDFAPTLLEFFNVPIPETMQGIPLRERIANDQDARPAGLFGMFGGQVNVTDGRYVYMRAPVRPENTPLFEYTLMPTHMRDRFAFAELQDLRLAEPFSFTQGIRPLKIPARTYVNAHAFGTMLFNLATDPAQEHPIIDDDVELRMIRLMIEWMHWNDAPPEQFERLGLPIEGEIRPEHLLCARQHELVFFGRHFIRSRLQPDLNEAAFLIGLRLEFARHAFCLLDRDLGVGDGLAFRVDHLARDHALGGGRQSEP